LTPTTRPEDDVPAEVSPKEPSLLGTILLYLAALVLSIGTLIIMALVVRDHPELVSEIGLLTPPGPFGY
jgi:hypothetical protein